MEYEPRRLPLTVLHAKVQTVEMSIGDLYTKAEVPHRIVNVNGKMLPILDRRGWLHLITFEARAAPGESHEVGFPYHHPCPWHTRSSPLAIELGQVPCDPWSS